MLIFIGGLCAVLIFFQPNLSTAITVVGIVGCMMLLAGFPLWLAGGLFGVGVVALIMLGFTGTHNGKPVSVMGHGMGIPSIGIYTYELYNFYGVKNIIRVGSCGSIHNDLKVGDLVIAMGACTNSNYAMQYELPGTYAPIADFDLCRRAAEAAEKYGYNYKVGNVFSSDTFYTENAHNDKWMNMGVLAVEMEAPALYMNAARSGNKALVIRTVSDHILTGQSTTSEERQNSFTHMMDVAFSLL
jgi:purine-nucleoside phosphorylase